MKLAVPTLQQDFAFAWLQLRKAPGFAVAAVITLALGIGANTAMFTVIDGVLLKPLSYRHADRLVAIGSAQHEESYDSLSWPTLSDIRQQSKLLSDAAGYVDDLAIVQGANGGRRMLGTKVTCNLMDVLEAKPIIGHSFNEENCRTGASRTVMLSESVWQSEFERSPTVIGQKIRIGDIPHTVIGVMSAGFTFPEEDRAEASKGIWLPSRLTTELKERGFSLYNAVGQLKPGVTLAQAQAELSAIARNISRANPKEAANLVLSMRPYRKNVSGQVEPFIWGLAAALGLVLLIACGNVANLQLSRCLMRQQEFAVRAALGASKSALLREMVVEGALISSLGTLAGVQLAWAILAGLRLLPAEVLPLSDTIGIRWSILLPLAGLAALSTILSSALPASLAMRAEPQNILRGTGRGVSGSLNRSRWSALLVAGEVALAVSLLVACSLLFRTLYNIQHKALGLNSENLTTFTATPPSSGGYLSGHSAEAAVASNIEKKTYAPLLEELRQMPGVKTAALASSIPFDDINFFSSFGLDGVKPQDAAAKQKQHAKLRVASGDFSAALGTPLLKGRAIADSDTEGRQPVAVVNQEFVREFSATKDPIGRTVDLGGKDTGMVPAPSIVGVVADAVQKGPADKIAPEVTLSYRQIPPGSLFYPLLLESAVKYAVRSSGDADVAPAIRQIFRKEAPGFAIDDLRTMRQTIDKASFNGRLGFSLLGAFAGLAVLMVAVGLYGVLSQAVSYRRQEIGVRMALGAQRSSVIALILRQGALLVGAGMAAGLAASVALSRFITSFLFGVEPTDAFSYAAALFFLAGIGLIATLIPAGRAAAVEPTEALRAQ